MFQLQLLQMLHELYDLPAIKILNFAKMAELFFPNALPNTIDYKVLANHDEIE